MVLSNVAILQCFLKIAKCCRVFIKKVKSLQILQSVAKFYKKVKSLQILQSLQIWQNFYKCRRIYSAFKYCRVLKIMQMLQPFSKKKKDRKKKCNVAEPTVMAELSKCCSAFSVANIAVPSNIAKCCRVLYKRKQEVCNVCRAYRCDGSFGYCSAFNGCNYFTDLKNVANVAKTFRNKKANIAEPTDMVELSNVAMLSYVANITVPSKYCNMLQSYKKKNK